MKKPQTQKPKRKREDQRSNDPFLVALGQVLAEERIRVGFSQEDAARATGFQRPYISRIELGASMSVINLSKLALGLGVHLSELVKKAEQRKQENEKKFEMVRR